jgi:hypothetical protein
MPIVRLAERAGVFGPDQITVLTLAYEAALGRLGITDRTSASAEKVAKTIIEIARAGERDPDRIRESAIKEFSSP